MILQPKSICASLNLLRPFQCGHDFPAGCCLRLRCEDMDDDDFLTDRCHVDGARGPAFAFMRIPRVDPPNASHRARARVQARGTESIPQCVESWLEYQEESDQAPL